MSEVDTPMTLGEVRAAMDPERWSEFAESKAPVRLGFIAQLAKHLEELWHASNAKNIQRNARLDALEIRCAALEQRSTAASVKWAGVFRAGTTYDEAQLCTHAGALWLSRKRTDAKPGTADWVLICKRGSFEEER